MTDKKVKKNPGTSHKKKSDLADKRAANLRANLQRRKAQTRERKES